MSLIHPDDRPKATLRAVIAFAKARDRWPDATELRTSNRKLGCERTVQVQLAALRKRGLVELRGWSAGARWVVTAQGFDLLGKPIFAPSLERQKARTDAAHLLAVPQTQPNRSPWPKRRSAIAEIADALLEVYG